MKKHLRNSLWAAASVAAFIVSVLLYTQLFVNDPDDRDKIEPAALTVNELYTNPDKYHKKRVTVRGYYYIGTEQVVLVSNVTANPETGDRFISRDQIWIGWKVTPPRELHDRLNTLPGIGQFDYYGQVEFTGIFHIANKKAGSGNEKDLGAGHLGEYPYSLGVESVSIFDEESGKYIHLPPPERRRR